MLNLLLLELRGNVDLLRAWTLPSSPVGGP